MENHKLVLPGHLNHYGFLFGGHLLKWVDEWAYISAALEYPDSDFVTVGMDDVAFKKSVPRIHRSSREITPGPFVRTSHGRWRSEPKRELEQGEVERTLRHTQDLLPGECFLWNGSSRFHKARSIAEFTECSYCEAAMARGFKITL